MPSTACVSRPLELGVFTASPHQNGPEVTASVSPREQDRIRISVPVSAMLPTQLQFPYLQPSRVSKLSLLRQKDIHASPVTTTTFSPIGPSLTGLGWPVLPREFLTSLPPQALLPNALVEVGEVGYPTTAHHCHCLGGLCSAWPV